MLSSSKISEKLEADYEALKQKSATLFATLDNNAERKKLGRGENMLSVGEPGDVIFLLDGFLKLSQGDREVRFYSEGDFVPTSGWAEDFTISSEFVSGYVSFSAKQFIAILSADAKLLASWLEILEEDRRINLQLCAAFVPDDANLNFEFRTYKSGDVCITEGEEASHVFEIVSGRVEATLNGEFLGEISQGEIFGEVGFLSGGKCAATVLAKGDCMTRVVDKEGFFRAMEVMPHFSMIVCKTMAQRVKILVEKLSCKDKSPD